ncbi:PQQ-binding-like beta-propeller repeat protein [bacterium]|nr:PQQ-binding-like beta-propeller repeat protein [bacterium]
MNLHGMLPPQSAAGIACLLVLLSLCSCAAQLAGSDSVAEQVRARPQSIDHTQLQRSGRSPFRAPQSFNTRDVDPGTAILHVNLREYRSEAVVADDGTVYIVLGDEYPRLSGERMDLLAIGPQGRLDWHFPLGHTGHAQVQLDNNGLAYVSHGNAITRLDSAGIIERVIPLGTECVDFSVGDQGQLLTISDDFIVQSRDGLGRLIWTADYLQEADENPGWDWQFDPADLPGGIAFHPGTLILYNGRQLFHLGKGLVALDEFSDQTAHLEIPGGVIAGAAQQGPQLVLTTHDGTIQSLDELGRLRWLTTLPDFMNSRPCIDSQDNVIACNTDGYVLSISVRGGVNWITALNPDESAKSPRWPPPHYRVMLSADDQILITDSSGGLYCLDDAGELRFSIVLRIHRKCHAAFGPEGRIHAFAGNRYVIIGDV